jgi:hypothetical protein
MPKRSPQYDVTAENIAALVNGNIHTYLYTVRLLLIHKQTTALFQNSLLNTTEHRSVPRYVTKQRNTKRLRTSRYATRIRRFIVHQYRTAISKVHCWTLLERSNKRRRNGPRQGRWEMHTKITVRKSERKRSHGRSWNRWENIRKALSNEQGVSMRSGLICLRTGSNRGSCYGGNGTVDAVKDGKCLGKLTDYQLLINGSDLFSGSTFSTQGILVINFTSWYRWHYCLFRLRKYFLSCAVCKLNRNFHLRFNLWGRSSIKHLHLHRNASFIEKTVSIYAA